VAFVAGDVAEEIGDAVLALAVDIKQDQSLPSAAQSQ
jgi:hypothetical protein